MAALAFHRIALVACIGVACQARKEQPMLQPPVLRTLTVDAAASPEYLLVALHGVGSSADDLLPLAQVLAPQLPTVAMAIPDGLATFDGGPPGRQWFSVQGVTPANRVARIGAVIPPLSAWIDAELARRNLGADRLILLGFSQGAIVSNWLALGRAPSPHAVVSIAGRLAVPEELRAAGSPHVLVVHGTADAVIPAAESAVAAAGLTARGAEVTHEVIPGLGHSIDKRALDLITAFLTREAQRSRYTGASVSR